MVVYMNKADLGEQGAVGPRRGAVLWGRVLWGCPTLLPHLCPTSLPHRSGSRTWWST